MKVFLEVGSNVEYAIHLEKRYGNFAYSLEKTVPKMEEHMKKAYMEAIRRIAMRAGAL